jgi:hypothetical protein
MKLVSFHRLAMREIQEATRFYTEMGRGEEFVEQIERSIKRTQRFPESAPQPWGSVRRLVVPKFPYNLLFRQGDAIRILAVAHRRRNPAYWVGRR